MPEPRVFIVVRNSRFDVSSAKEFGSVEFIFDSDDAVSPFDLPDVIMSIEDELSERDFDPSVDYVALTGPTIMVATLYAVVMGRYGTVRTLLFDARKEGYRERSARVTRWPAGFGIKEAPL